MWFWIVLIAVPIVLALLFWLIIKSIWKAISLAFGIIIILLAVLGVLIVQDSREFSKNLMEKDNAFYLEDNGKLLAGAVNLLDPQRMKTLSQEEFSGYASPKTDKDFKNLLGDNYKIFIIKNEAFSSLTDEDFKDQQLLNKPFIYSVLDSTDPVGVFVDESIKGQPIPTEQLDAFKSELRKKLPPEQQLRATMFALLFGTLMQKNGPMVILEEYKKGNIIIYPETIMFKTIGYMPDAVFEYAKNAQAMQLKAEQPMQEG